MKHSAIVVCALLAACVSPPELPKDRLVPSDFAAVTGAGWTGSLTYRDYSPPFGDVTIPAELTVTETPAGLQLAYAYPDEPQANAQSMLALTENGTVLNGVPVTGILRFNNAVAVTAQSPCEDNNQAATCFYDYLLGAKELTIRKQVQLSGTADAFQRNIYSFTRP